MLTKKRRAIWVGAMAAGAATLVGDPPLAHAADACDYLPKSAQKVDWVESFSDSLCNINCAGWPPGVGKPSAPVPSGTVPNLAYTDGSHGQCSFPKGVCKQDTVCAPGQDRVSVGGVWKCRSRELKTVTFDPRAACKANLTAPPFKVESVIVNGSGSVARRSSGCARSGSNTLTIKGTNVGLAEKISFGVSGISAVRERSSPICAAPACVRYSIYVPETAPVGPTSVKLSFWGGRKSDSGNFEIAATPKPAVCPGVSVLGVKAGAVAPTGAAGAAATPAPTVISGRRFCENGLAKVTRTPTTFTLAQAQVVSVANQLVTTGCTSALTNMSSSGAFHIRAQGEDGIGSEVAFGATWVSLPAGTWELNLSEGSTPAGNYKLSY